jgi:hypothetical protein
MITDKILAAQKQRLVDALKALCLGTPSVRVLCSQERLYYAASWQTGDIKNGFKYVNVNHQVQLAECENGYRLHKHTNDFLGRCYETMYMGNQVFKK